MTTQAISILPITRWGFSQKSALLGRPAVLVSVIVTLVVMSLLTLSSLWGGPGSEIDWKVTVLGPLSKTASENPPPPWGLRDPDSYLDHGPAPLDNPPPLNFPLTPPKKPGMSIPNVVHLIRFSPDGDSAELLYWEYLTIRAIMLVQSPEVIYLHCNAEPVGPWWNEVAHAVTISNVELPEHIYDRPVDLMAHKADIIRLMVVEKLGGIYIDFDVFLIRPLDELLYAPMTMGIQDENYGLCNAVIISEPKSSFLERYIDSYRQFDRNFWDWNSVIRSFEIARKYPHEIQTIESKGFFSPGWDLDVVIWEDDKHWDFEASHQYMYHAWHSGQYKRLEALNPFKLREQETSVSKMLRRYIGQNDEAIWNAIEAASTR